MDISRAYTFKFQVVFECTIASGFLIKRERKEELNSYFTINVNAKNLRRASFKARERMKTIIEKQVKMANDTNVLAIIDNNHNVSKVKNIRSIDHVNYKLLSPVVSAGRNFQTSTN